jgi:glycosyltransferase involved in cell wall biosynthesis
MLAIGALHPRKRYRLMIGNLAPLLRESDARLAIAGDGGERDSLQRAAIRHGIAGRLHFLGDVHDIAEPLAVADLVVHTSSVEGVPQALVQALAAGKPVVATDVTGLREIPGAPITIVPPSGSGLAEAAARTLESGSPTALEPSVFRPWTHISIDLEIAAFHASH